jgi:hypothetical protein
LYSDLFSRARWMYGARERRDDEIVKRCPFSSWIVALWKSGVPIAYSVPPGATG